MGITVQRHIIDTLARLLQHPIERIDYMALHRYAHLHNDDLFENYMAFMKDFDEHLTAYDGLIRFRLPGKG